MDKDQALTGVLKELKISLNNASIYSHEHPFFVKSVEKLKGELDKILKTMVLLRIGVMPHSLVIDGNNWDKEKLHRDLAEFFHRRKIKAIEFKEGMGLGELITFLMAINMPAEEILNRSGLANILKTEGVRHIIAEDLDYSPFLDTEGTQDENIWNSLLNRDLQKTDSISMESIENNFINITKRIKTKDLLTNERLRSNITKLLDYLKDADRDKFKECSRALVRAIVKEKALSKEEDFEKVKSFFKDMSSSELSQAIWEDIVSDKDFDPASFNVFSSLIAKDKEQDVAQEFANRFEENKEDLKDNPQALDRVRELLASSSTAGVSEVYRKALVSFLSGEEFKEGVHLDRGLLKINYRLTLLNSLVAEESGEGAQVIIDEITKELKGGDIKDNIDFIKNTLKAIEVIFDQGVSFSDMLLGLRKEISGLIEDAIIKEEAGFEFSQLIDGFKELNHPGDFYLKKIFDDSIVNGPILRLFIKFFPQESDAFNKRLQKRSYDVNFIKQMIDSIKRIDSKFSLDVLKNIFSFSNAFIKGEVLGAMNELSHRDYEFLLSILRGPDVFLKKGALQCLVDDSKQAKKAAGIMLAFKNPLGIHSVMLSANIQMIEEVGLKDARRYLQHLAQRRFFWNKGVRERAKKALRKLSNE